MLFLFFIFVAFIDSKRRFEYVISASNVAMTFCRIVFDRHSRLHHPHQDHRDHGRGRCPPPVQRQLGRGQGNGADLDPYLPRLRFDWIFDGQAVYVAVLTIGGE